jgi:tight adherence protein B
MDQSLLVSILVFLLVAQATLLVANSGSVERQKVARRLDSYIVPTFEAGLPATVSILRRRRYSRLPLLDALLVRFDMADNLGRRLQQAGVPLRAGEFLFLQLVLATVFGLLGALFGWELAGGPSLALVGVVLGFVGPMAWLRLRISRRMAAFEQGLPDVLDRVSNALRAGFGLEYGLDLVSRESGGPCGEEFGQVLQELNLGADLDEALARLIVRIDSEDARLLATAVSVQRRTGGNLIEVLSQMSQTLRDRERLRRDVRVITTAPRVSGYVVALLPLLTVAAMYVTSRYYIETLFSEPIGRLAALAGFTLVLLGLFLNHRIARVDL